MRREKGHWKHLEGREEKAWQGGQRDEQKAFWVHGANWCDSGTNSNEKNEI